MVAAAASVGCLVAVSWLVVVFWGSRFASVQVEATPRVDVDEAPDVDETVYIDSGFLGSGTNSERVKSPSSWPSQPTLGCASSVTEYLMFVVPLSGLSRCVRVQAHWKVRDLERLVSEVTGISTQCFYLINNGSRVESDGDLRCVDPDSRVLMTERLAGGARPVIPGEWKCAVCSAMGCRPTRKTCYRCGPLRSETAPAQPGPFVNGYNGNFREQNGLGQPTPPTQVVVPPRLAKAQRKAARQRYLPSPLCACCCRCKGLGRFVASPHWHWLG